MNKELDKEFGLMVIAWMNEKGVTESLQMVRMMGVVANAIVRSAEGQGISRADAVPEVVGAFMSGLGFAPMENTLVDEAPETEGVRH